MSNTPAQPPKDTLKKIETTFDNQGNIKTNKKKNSLLPKILSVVAAIALWLYVFQAVEEERDFKAIPIALENFNTSLGLDVVSGYESTLDVTISGTKSVISNITSNDIKASVDLGSVVERGTYVLDINIDVPANTKIVNNSVTQLKISVDKTVEKQIEITPMLNYNIQYPYELGEVSLSETSVKLSGPETDINSVAKAVVQVNLGSVKNNIVSNSEVTLYDANNYEIQSQHIIITPSAIELSVPVYKTSLFGVQPDIVIDKERFSYSVSPSTVYLKGLVNDVETYTMLRTQRIWIDAAGEYDVPLMLTDGVNAYTNYSAAPETQIQTVKITVTEIEPVSVEENQENTEGDTGNGA